MYGHGQSRPGRKGSGRLNAAPGARQISTPLVTVWPTSRWRSGQTFSNDRGTNILKKHKDRKGKSRRAALNEEIDREIQVEENEDDDVTEKDVAPDDEDVAPDDKEVTPDDDEEVMPDDEEVTPDDEEVVPNDEEDVAPDDEEISSDEADETANRIVRKSAVAGRKMKREKATKPSGGKQKNSTSASSSSTKARSASSRKFRSRSSESSN